MIRNLVSIVAFVAAATAVDVAQTVTPGTGTPGVLTPVAAAAATATAAAKGEQEVQKAERDRFEAMVKADTGALNKLLAPELSYTHSNAQVQDKAGFIADIGSKTIRYLSIEPSDVHVLVLGTTAVVTGVAAVHVLQNGNDTNIKFRFTNVHINRRGEWQMLAWQATKLVP